MSAAYDGGGGNGGNLPDPHRAAGDSARGENQRGEGKDCSDSRGRVQREAEARHVGNLSPSYLSF